MLTLNTTDEERKKRSDIQGSGTEESWKEGGIEDLPKPRSTKMERIPGRTTERDIRCIKREPGGQLGNTRNLARSRELGEDPGMEAREKKEESNSKERETGPRKKRKLGNKTIGTRMGDSRRETEVGEIERPREVENTEGNGATGMEKEDPGRPQEEEKEEPKYSQC